MDKQRRLFEHGDKPAPWVRGSETSHAAARSMDQHLGRLQSVVLEFIRSRGEHGATDQEVQIALDLAPQTQGPRRIELENKGFVRRTDRARKTTSGRRARVYVAVG